MGKRIYVHERPDNNVRKSKLSVNMRLNEDTFNRMVDESQQVESYFAQGDLQEDFEVRCTVI